ncbi:tRNA pseudouridine(38-40) synthase TruA [Portibacter lacus]|uniref:tRNA pseudouridine synthase A n=1 Tax=Portibacter lacus TaxID=1099794 RepID=A0AA37WE15_9BACT|nr:tRNA pseudouridine(38-40) synthase TruA [Portibacter lacus]GLR15630.1 tRNA pseudouridine synthase A [Portibacter lacus]
MIRYFFEISFNGSNYSGWQRQKTAPSVQQTIEDAFATILQRKVIIHGCGRTDAGVHASQYFFHVDLEIDPTNLTFKMNRMLPRDIAMLGFTAVSEKANAQKYATARTYQYRLSHLKNPFTNQYTTAVLTKLDHLKMDEAISYIIGNKDFENFCKRPKLMNNTMCTIFNASVMLEEESQTIIITVRGSRFLHHMMRLLVGNLIKIGNESLHIDEFKDYIDLKNKPKHFELAPAQGLTLTKIEYDSINLNLD